MRKIKATRHEIPTPVHFWTAFTRQDTCVSCAFNFCLAAIRHFLHCVQFIVFCICTQSCFASWQAIRSLLAKSISNQSYSAWKTKKLLSAVQRITLTLWQPCTRYRTSRAPKCLNRDPIPLSRKRVCPPPEPKGGGDTFACRWGAGGGPNSDDWRKSLVLCLLSAAKLGTHSPVGEGRGGGPNSDDWRKSLVPVLCLLCAAKHFLQAENIPFPSWTTFYIFQIVAKIIEDENYKNRALIYSTGASHAFLLWNRYGTAMQSCTLDSSILKVHRSSSDAKQEKKTLQSHAQFVFPCSFHSNTATLGV